MTQGNLQTFGEIIGYQYIFWHLRDYVIIDNSYNCMRTPPESYLIFKEELKKAAVEKAKLQESYEAKIDKLNKELSYLKEQIMSQQDMMKTTVEYATKLENELSVLQDRIDKDSKNANKSFH